MFKKSLFIFRRDLRLDDNIGLIRSLQESKKVIPAFIFDPNQITSKNKFKSNNALQFMLDSLQDLEGQLQKINAKLYVFYGKPEQIVNSLIVKEKIDAVFVNEDYTPYSKTRDAKIKKICDKSGVNFKCHQDTLLNPPDKVLKKDAMPYTIFTPFFKKSIQFIIQKPIKLSATNFYINKIKQSMKLTPITKKLMLSSNKVTTKNKDSFSGGRNNALKILQNIKNFKNYKIEHDIPGLSATTKLSAHNKFGTVSIREVYYEIAENLGKNHPIIRQLYWRDFFTHIASHFPHIFGHEFNQKYKNIKWDYDTKKFQSWCNGKTGFPIVDAGMRELNTTGFMQNRVRMITASFLVKDLHIDWRLGEKYFATKLVDYDPSVNNGNWQWVASTGCDAQPYFRIFNPWIQQKKFDPECIYIKKWISDLKKTEPKNIHKLFKPNKFVKNYPKPIVDHGIESKVAILRFRKARMA